MQLRRTRHPVPRPCVRPAPLPPAIALRTGIRHESPQVIVLAHGAAVWSASHGAITAAAVLHAVAVLPPEPQPDPRPEPVPLPQPPPLPVPDVPVQ